MEVEFYNLYNTLSCYKRSIVRNLEKVDEIVMQAVNEYGDVCPYTSLGKKYNLSLEMLKILQTYIKILFLSETVVEELSSNQSERGDLGRDSRVSGCRRSSNPFAVNAFRDILNNSGSIITANEVISHDDQNKTKNLDGDSTDGFISETETLVDFSTKQKCDEILVPEKVIEKRAIKTETVNLKVDEEEIVPVRENFEKAAAVKSFNEKHELDKSVKTEKPDNNTEFNKPPLLKNKTQKSPETNCNFDDKLLVLNNDKHDNDVKIPINTNYNETTINLLTNTSIAIKEESLTEPLENVAAKSINGNKLFEDLQFKPKVQTLPEPYTPKKNSELQGLPENHFDKPVIKPKEMKPTKVSNVTLPKRSPSQQINSPKYSPDSINKSKKSPLKTGAMNSSNQSNSTPSPLSEVHKLLKMTVPDRKREVDKRYDGKLSKNFEWRTIQKSSTLNEKKSKEKPPVHYVLADDVLRKGQKCIFSHIESPVEFYVRTNQELFENLETSSNEDLNSMYQYVVANYQSKKEAKDLLGGFCFAFLPEKRKWFRVQVIDWMEDELENVFVQLVDYGHKCFCRYKSLKRMMDLYAEFPKMAIRCHFLGIYSPNKENKQWPQDSVDVLIALSEMKDMTKFVVIHAYKEGDSYAVDLTKENSNKSIGEILVENKLALEEKLPQDNGLNVIEEEDDDFMDYDNINEAIAGYDARDEARICPFTDKSGRCYKGPSCKLDHSQLSPDGITTDKVVTMNQALATVTPPSSGELITLLITGYINTCHFYAQIIRNPSKTGPFNEELQRLIDVMNLSKNIQTYEPFKVYPGIGEIILAEYSGKWQRATCVELQNGQVKVFLVDFGVTLVKQMKDIRQMQEDFLHVPFQAVECMLDTCCERRDATPTTSWGFFKKCMDQKIFKALVVGSPAPLRLQLWDKTEMEMSYVLIQAGLAQKRNSNMFPSIFSCG